MRSSHTQISQGKFFIPVNDLPVIEVVSGSDSDRGLSFDSSETFGS